MHVTIFYPGKIPVHKYGGTGRDVWYEGRELCRLGHKVTYLVGRGSKCDFANVIEYDPGMDYNAQIPDVTDIVHFHLTPRAPVLKPYIVTIHGNPRLGEEIDINTVFVSRDHANRYGSDLFVYNGMDWDDYGPVDLTVHRTHFHFLGKAAWRVKNLRGAIDVTKAAGEKLIVIGGYRLNFRMGFRFIPDRHVSFGGIVGGEKKYSVMRNSKGLIFPVLWNEPMGLAIIESLYFGAPVFGTPYGSLPEIVNSEVGFLSNSRESLAKVLKEAGNYSPARCHEYAVDSFNAGKMTREYLRLFSKVLNGESLNPVKPSLKYPDNKDLLPWYS